MTTLSSKCSNGCGHLGYPGGDVGTFIGAQNAQINLAVPEPRTYALMALGLAVVEFAARRK